MSEPNENTPATVPEQPVAKLPVRKTMPVVIALVVIVALIGIANLTSLLHGNRKAAPPGTVPAMRPAAPNAQEVSSFETQQQLQAKRDTQQRQYRQELAQAKQELQSAEAQPGPEGNNVPPMTAEQRAAIYGSSPNAPVITSEASQARAEAKQRVLAKQREHQQAIDSDTEAIDFEQKAPSSENVQPEVPESVKNTGTTKSSAVQPTSFHKKNTGNAASAMAPYNFDHYQGKLYRIFEGTILEGVVTNHIDGGFSGPVLVMLTTDYYSHNHQHLLLPQGTRLIGTVQSVGNAQQRKLFVVFHRAICPDGFSLSLDNYVGLDQIGTTGLATKVHHGYFQAFAAAAAIGGLGGLAQIGNNGTILDPSTQIRNGISEQSAAEGEQVLNHFLDRLPVITLKEGSRARIYVSHDILVPSYAEHRVNPNL
ncbi:MULTISPECIES: TrbI/VirB10 family protein [Acidobacterium]|uniref:Putative conjugal transfer protein, TrbI family n=1 Tax=Acidobacterium capsulatum (strain ATCC 51196 / DSM 11244 / BCRC 80197 / JCM 7670 / NBRC 15755 / NCIMB 13165 / 161) TaxID=240015 RepID=C1F5S5_ACIC5|nr:MULTISPECIES: TrbI/VirB10 family protein [Acidobacterium]ACO32899.1 putative conjugal transfer protein, TrbI family [Acidobacterium capsulatum ATCC 51196]HCT61081.1 conjugal transfer protein TrbI [Acidobacterium sp.]